MSTKKSNNIIGTTQAAKLMGVHPSTLRKKAKAGKVPGAVMNANGEWQFNSTDLFFLSAKKPNPTPPSNKLTDVIFVLDRSGSMNSLIGKARNNLCEQVRELAAAASPENQYRVSVINFDDHITITSRAVPVGDIKDPGSLYLAPNGWTKLSDAVNEAMTLANSLDTGDRQHAFLISVVTDGVDNASVTPPDVIAIRLAGLVSSDRYTFVYAGPVGSKRVGVRLGFADGNCTEWNQTDAGIRDLGRVTNSSLNTYTASRSIGSTNSKSFYAAPVTTDAAKFADQLDDKLDDVSARVKVERVSATDPLVIRKFCEQKFGSFFKGQIYYQLTESEKVQDYKKLIIQDTATGNFYAGETAAKKLLGVPKFTGTVKIKPGKMGEFKVFVQSTSVNRKLTSGTTVVYLP